MLEIFRGAMVYENEVDAIKDSRRRDMPLFEMAVGDKSRWVVAVSDHQARLAMVSEVFTLRKPAKKDRDDRYTELLEQAIYAKEMAKA